MKVEGVAGSLASEKVGEGGVPAPGEVVIAEKIGGRGSRLFLSLYCNYVVCCIFCPADAVKQIYFLT